MIKKLMTPNETAEVIRLSTATLAKLRVIGGGPRFAKVGSRIFYEERDVDEWIEARKRNSTSEYVRRRSRPS